VVKWDAIVVGGSVAGATAAYYLAREGRRVVLFEKETFPRAKPCGEGILPHGLPVLAEMGVLEEVRRRGRAFPGLLYRNRRGTEASADFSDGPGIAVRREVLDEILLRRAAEFATVREGRAVEEVFEDGVRAGGERLRAPLVVVADGAQSRARAQLGIRTIPPRRLRYGLVGHWAARAPERVEVTLIDGGERYVAPVGDGLVLAALLLEKRVVDGDVYRRRAGIEGDRVGPVLAVGPLGLRAERCVAGGAVLVGDAAGAPDPMTGEGIALALRCARRIDPAEHERLRAAAYAFSDRMLWLTRLPWAADRAVERLAREPARFRALLDAAGRGEAPDVA
jgi:flavin-dependent dehydrogenase